MSPISALSPSDSQPLPIVERTTHAAESLSPSLRGTASDSRPAFEIKLAVALDLAREIEVRLRPRMTLDPHARVDADDTYEITSLYTDTPAWDVYHRRGPLKSVKYRVRRYGDGPLVYLEQKRREDRLVSKLRTRVSQSELPDIASTDNRPDWDANWYRAELVRRQLRPVCQVSYLRKAFFASSEQGPVRLTFDSRLRGTAVDRWGFAPDSIATPFAADVAICEFKFLVAMPTLFRNVFDELQLLPGSFSKYRQCVQALDILPAQEGSHA